MAFYIRDKDTQALIRELARLQGVSIEHAIKDAVKEKLAVLRRSDLLHAEFSKIAQEIARFPRTGLKADKKSFDELSEGN